MDRRRELPFVAALLCLLGLGAVGLYGLAWNAGRARDAAMLHGFAALDQTRIYTLSERLVSIPDPIPYAIICLLLMAIAFWRHHPARAVTVLVLFIGTGATTQALKHGLATERFSAFLGYDQIENVSWPSGHSTAAMTIALCAVLVAPPALRAVTALVGGTFAIGVGYATLVLTWHYPSDVMGGFMVAGLWTSLAVAVLQRVEAEDEEAAPVIPWRPLVAIGGVGSVLAAAILGAKADAVSFYAEERTTVVAGALVIAVIGLVLAAVVSAATGPGGPRARSAPSP